MAVSTVTNTITGLDGTTGLPDIPVVVRLMPSGGWVTATGAEIVREYRTVTNASGIWSLSLTETADITPGNTWYEVIENIPRAYGGPRKCNIQVGAANTTLYAALISTPATVPTTQYLTQAAADARYVLAPGSFGAAVSMAESRPSDTATAGVLAEYARIDHRHDREIISGTAAARAALAGTDLFAGLHFYETDTTFLYVRTASAWEWVSCTDPPRVKLHLAANQTIATGTVTAVLFGATTEDYDVGGCHSTTVSTNRITVPAGYGGLWAVFAMVSWLNSSEADTQRVAFIDKNVVDGSARMVSSHLTKSTVDSPITHILYTEEELVAGDFMSLEVFHTRGSSLDLDYDSGGVNRGVTFGARFIRPL